jgi:hypothetical protein
VLATDPVGARSLQRDRWHQALIMLTLSQDVRQMLCGIKDVGVREIRIYKSHDYISVVTFVLCNRELVSIRARAEGAAPRFEVFLISASDETITAEPDVTLQSSDYQQVEKIFILSKWNWEVPSSDEDKAESLGDTAEGTTVVEGLESDIPDNALNCVRFETGIKVQFADSSCFFVVSSINPYDLAVNHDVSFSQVEDREYSFETLC